MNNENLLYILLAVVVGIVVIWFLVGYFGRSVIPNQGELTMHSNPRPATENQEPTNSNKESMVVSGDDVQSRNPATNVGQNVENMDNPTTCFPKDQLRPEELLPNDYSSQWAKCLGKDGDGALKGQNFLEADRFMGISSVGQVLRNANQQIRSEPPNPQVVVAPWNQSTIPPDVSRRYFEVGEC